jgi:hypothetical protein
MSEQLPSAVGCGFFFAQKPIILRFDSGGAQRPFNRPCSRNSMGGFVIGGHEWIRVVLVFGHLPLARNFHVSRILETSKCEASGSAVAGSFFLNQKTDPPFARLRWCHQLPDSIEDRFELSVVFPLQCV